MATATATATVAGWTADVRPDYLRAVGGGSAGGCDVCVANAAQIVARSVADNVVIGADVGRLDSGRAATMRSTIQTRGRLDANREVGTSYSPRTFRT